MVLVQSLMYEVLNQNRLRARLQTLEELERARQELACLWRTISVPPEQSTISSLKS
jgi:hypothetical protein